MSNKERKTEVNINLVVDSVRSAAKNAKHLEEVVLDVPCVDPKDLTIDDKIYGLKIVPVDDKVERPTPSTLCSVGVVEINVDTLSGVVQPGMVTINGTINIPKEIGGTSAIQDVYFEEKEYARAVAMTFLEEEYAKAEASVSAAKQVRDYLKEQLDEKRV